MNLVNRRYFFRCFFVLAAKSITSPRQQASIRSTGHINTEAVVLRATEVAQLLRKQRLNIVGETF